MAIFLQKGIGVPKVEDNRGGVVRKAWPVKGLQAGKS